MYKRHIFLILIFILIISVSLILRYKEALFGQQSPINISVEVLKKDKLDHTQFPRAIENLSVNKEFYSKLIDKNIEPKIRMRMMMNLYSDQNHSERIQEILRFIVSENPYEGMNPHTTDELRFQKEAALRVFGLRQLSEKMPTEAFGEIVSYIEENSKDETIKRIANQAFEAKKKNQNYFDDIKRGIQSMPL